MNPIPVVFVLIKNERGEILILKRSVEEEWYPNTWNILTGKIEDGENPDAAMKREIQEELGLFIDSYDEAVVPYVREMDNKQWLIHAYRVTVLSTTSLQINHEHSEYAWITVDDLAKFDVLFPVRITLEAFGRK